MVVNTGVPFIADVYNDTPIFRNDVLARNEGYTIEADAAFAVGDDITQFDERVPPIDRIEDQTAKQLEPSLVKIMLSFLVLVAVGINEFERASKNESLTLFNAAREVSINLNITVDVV